MRLVPASGRSAPCVQHQTRNGDPDADLGAAPDRQKSVQFSVVIDKRPLLVMHVVPTPRIACRHKPRQRVLAEVLRYPL